MIKPHTKKELAGRYEVKPKVISTWLKPYLQEIGPKHGRYYTMRQVEIIFRLIGTPPR